MWSGAGHGWKGYNPLSYSVSNRVLESLHELMNLILRWLLVSVGLWITCAIGGALGLGLAVDEKHPWHILIAGAVVGLVNSIIVPLAKLLTLPLHCLTLGISTFIINAIFFLIIGQMDLGIQVASFWGAAFGVICLSIVGSVLGLFLPDKRKEDQ